MNSKNKTIFLSVLGILISILTIIGIGYAFYHARSNIGVTNIDLLSDTSDYLSFKNGDKLEIKPNQYNLEEGIGDIVSEATATANLKANSYNKNVTATYNAYFKISTNEYIYTNGTTPEIILEITKPDGTKVTSISGLTYVTVSDALAGFDITTKSGIFILAEDYSIASTNSDEGVNQNWIIKITYRNLDTDQIANEAKTFNAEVMLQKEKIEIPIPLTSTLLANNGGASAIEAKGMPNFATVATTNEGMYAAQDDYGTSYYFRGAVDNNWVKFEGFYWRIVRINGNGSVKLIYSGTAAPTESQKVVMTGEGTQIGVFSFSSYSQAEYVGYMYTLGEVHGTGTSSAIKTRIDTWYEANLASYSNYLSDTIFCNDRSPSTSSSTLNGSGGTGKTVTYYGPYIRNYTNKAPILTCPNKSDAFTVSDTTKGNGALTYPVGLITADEVAMAGGVYSTTNSANYLNTNSIYWLASPTDFDGNVADGFFVSRGSLDYYYVGRDFGARPSVSLNSQIQVTGSGTWNDPYSVVGIG